MLAAAFLIASLMCSGDDIPVSESEIDVPEVHVVEEPRPEEVSESVVVQVSAQPFLPPTLSEPEPEEPAPLKHINIEEKMTPAMYQEQLMSLPPIYQPPPLSEIFMYEVLHRPNVQRIKEEDYRLSFIEAGGIAAYIWVSPTTPNVFLQYGTIVTAYGDIYVTCALDENGNIADPSKPLEVYYDNPSLQHIVATVALDYPHRFPTTGKFSVTAINNIDDLNFLFGDTRVAQDSYNVAFLL